MSDEALRRAFRQAESVGGVSAWMQAAASLRRAAGEGAARLRLAAAALDRAFALAPHDDEVQRRRREVLDALEIREHGLVFRYIPEGPFLMGSLDGDADERPVHERSLGGFWLTDVPISWTRYCALMGWEPPELGGMPAGLGAWRPGQQVTITIAPGVTARLDPFGLFESNKVRWQYCEDLTRRAVGWHAHHPGAAEDGPFGRADRGGSTSALSFEQKPMVGVDREQATWLAQRLTATSPTVRYRLPTEAEWEKAARGGLVGRRHAWGDEPPEGRCDFGRFEAFALQPSRQYPSNGYGLFSMNGGVWEWTSDDYDAVSYARARGPLPPPTKEGTPHGVLRGGSWADCADAVTVSFRMSRPADYDGSANIGFRLLREASS